MIPYLPLVDRYRSHLIKLFSLAFFLFLFLNKSVASASAASYYVATNGNDANPGTIESPLATINKGATLLNPGDTLYIRGGTYFQTVSIDKSGLPSSPITVSSYSGEWAVIDGNFAIPGYWGTLFNITGSYVTVRDLEVKNSAWMGMVLRGQHDEASNINSHHNMENGILITGDYGIVEKSKVWQNAYANVNCTNSRGNWASGLSAARNPNYAIIRNNEIFQNWGEGVSSFEAAYTTIEDNIVYDNFSVNAYISDTSYTVFQRNIVYSTSGNVASCGFQTGIAMSSEIGYANGNNTIVNNFVLGNKINFQYWNSNQGAGDGLINDVIAYNTFVNSAASVNIKIASSGYHSNTVFKNNIILQEDSLSVADVASGITYSNNNWSKTPTSGSGSGDVIGNPQLAKTGSTSAGQLTGEWFKSLSNSPATNKGVVISGISGDYFRTLRPQGPYPDIGGHEYSDLTPTSVSTPTPTALPNLTPIPGSGNGLFAEYFNNPDFSNLIRVQIDPTVNFDWGLTNPSGIDPETFSARWSGLLEAPYSGTYTFYTNSDDGVRLWVNNQKLIDNWTDHAATQNTGTINLSAGAKYPIKLEYYDNTYHAVIQLFWSHPNIAYQIIPKDKLFSSSDLTSTTTPKKGDADGDGDVDEGDYERWLLYYNPAATQTGGSSIGDFNNDSKVDGIDYTIWLNNYTG